MLPRDPLALPPVARTMAGAAVEAVGDPRQQAFQRALAGQLGKSMQGEVLARLADGGALVRVAGTPARMQLPAGFAAGAEVPLTLVALQPRPTFQVGPEGHSPASFTEAHAVPAEALPGHAAAAGGAPLSRAAALLGAAATPAQLPGLGPGDAAPTLSAAARAIGGMLAEAMKSGPPATAVAGGAPLVAARGGIDAGQLASALQGAISGSGLFYESHVAEWAAGQRPLAALAAEPQMQPARTPHDAAQLVNLQLAAHEQGQVAWQGQAWPGQPLQLELGRAPDEAVERDAPDRDGDAAPGAAWQSRLRLRFALLGEVSASVLLSGEQVHLRLDAASEPAGDLLRAHAARLAGALGAAGTELASLSIHAPGAGDA